MKVIKEMITGNPVRGNPGKLMSRVFVNGKGWYRWNWAYRVYNSEADYSQLTESDVELIDLEKESK